MTRRGNSLSSVDNMSRLQAVHTRGGVTREAKNGNNSNKNTSDGAAWELAAFSFQEGQIVRHVSAGNTKKCYSLFMKVQQAAGKTFLSFQDPQFSTFLRSIYIFPVHCRDGDDDDDYGPPCCIL